MALMDTHVQWAKMLASESYWKKVFGISSLTFVTLMIALLLRFYGTSCGPMYFKMIVKQGMMVNADR
jgi:hypothetical protein